MFRIYHKTPDAQRQQVQSESVSFHQILNQDMDKEVREAFLCISKTMREFFSRRKIMNENQQYYRNYFNFPQFALWFFQKYFNLKEQQGKSLLADISNSHVLKSLSYCLFTTTHGPMWCVRHVLTLLSKNSQTADFSYAPLAHADLSMMVLNGINLHHADLSDANISRSQLRRSNLTEANFINACFYETDLRDANFSCAVFQGLDFSSFLGSCLKGANFSNVKFKITGHSAAFSYDDPVKSIATINFEGSIGLDQADFSSILDFFKMFRTKYECISVDRDCSFFFKKYFSHLNNDKSSLLKMIDSIDSHFDSLKIYLMESFIENFSGIKYFKNLLNEFYDVFIQIFLNDKMVYIEKSEKIRNFLKKELLPVFLKTSIEVWTRFTPILCILIGEFILEKAPNDSKFILENKKIIDALLANCRSEQLLITPQFDDQLWDLNSKIQTLVYGENSPGF